MQFTLAVTSVRSVGGRVYVRWSDGVEQSFSSLAQAREQTRDELAANKDLLRVFALARYLRVDPNANNPNLLEGHSITYTDENNSMVTVT